MTLLSLLSAVVDQAVHQNRAQRQHLALSARVLAIMSSPGSKYLRYLQRRKIRASVESGLDAATTVPNSGFTFVENSQGASAAAVELSRSLDTAIEQIDLEGTEQSCL